MTHIAKTLRTLLTEYKRLLKRYFTPAEKERIVQKLQLKRTTLKHASEVTLYRKTLKAIEELEKEKKTHPNCSSEHSGLCKFLEHLKEQTQHYQIKGKNLIDPRQQASNVLVKAIQLLSLPPRKTRPESPSKLRSNTQPIRSTPSPTTPHGSDQTNPQHPVKKGSGHLNNEKG